MFILSIAKYSNNAEILTWVNIQVVPANIFFYFFLFLLELCNNTTHWKIKVLMSPKVMIASYIFNNNVRK